MSELTDAAGPAAFGAGSLGGPAPSGIEDTGTTGSGPASGGPGTTPAAATAWQPAAGGPPSPPAVTLPKGGGAVSDIGEKFSAAAATGTGTLTVPIPTSAGRAGFGPALSLAYDSGTGNGPFGLGWTLALPAITRKTNRGLPRYLDDPDADTFLLSGSEDLVPIRTERDGRWVETSTRRSESGHDYLVQGYRPRIEGLFSRIERWRDLDTGETHWRTISSADVTTFYGATAESRVADPADPSHVFSWLICAKHDDTGNAARYEYVPEDSLGIDPALPREQNRTAQSRSANCYLKRVRYGNTKPWQPNVAALRSDTDDHGSWLFEAVLDYGDHRPDAPTPTPDRPWPARPDPFSNNRAGFETRLYRRCHRVLMFHHFPDEPGVGADCLVTSTDLTYADTGGSGMTTIASVTHTGYRRSDDNAGYVSRSLPPLELTYSRPVIGSEVHTLSPETLADLPAGIDGTAYRWVDLDGEGLAGILATQGNAWFYRHNLGEGRFAPSRLLTEQPAGVGAAGRRQLLDLSGDGRLDFTELGGPLAGYYERTEHTERTERLTGAQGASWHPFHAFPSHPAIAWDDPDLRLVDLDGDGLADVLITGDDAFTWYPSLGPDGFGPGRRTYPTDPWNEERGPRLVRADPDQSIYFADMTGDGLSDLIRVRDGEVCYWPNTGYGRFGTKVTMDASPRLDHPGTFDQRRVRLADVDGTGCTDLVYLGTDGVRVYLNQSGNGYAPPQLLPQAFPRLDALAHVTVVDLLGRGTACLVWSSPLPGEAGRQVRYVDLMAAGKPYLLTGIVNNLGAETAVTYCASTKFFLADRAAGRPWRTRLPFPVHVVERVETVDRVNRNRFSTRHAYHHGHFDGVEREFRGFGMVEQWDTEELAVLHAGAEEFTNQGTATDLPPVLTRTWMHTGVFPGEDQISRHDAQDYWRQPGGGDPDLPDTALPTTLRRPGTAPRPWRLSRTEAREACRALKGLPLRAEVYALDGSEAEPRPYQVTEHNYTVELLQPAIDPVPEGPQNYHAVLLTHARETITANYERALYRVAGHGLRADPRIAHDLVLAIDDYGNPLRTVAAAYGRRHPDPRLVPSDQTAQARLLLTYTDSGYTNAVDLPNARRTPQSASVRTYEVTGLRPAERIFAFEEVKQALAAIRVEIPFQDWDADPATLPEPVRRLTGHAEVRYLRDDLSGPLPLGALESRALPYRSQQQVFTDSLVHELYDGAVDETALERAGYLRESGVWWLPSGKVFYSPDPADGSSGGSAGGSAAELDHARRHFFLPRRYVDQFGNATHVDYDRYDLLVRQTWDALGNRVSAGARNEAEEITTDGNDYRVLAPRLVSGPNRNRAAVVFDVLGRVAGTAVMGKPEEAVGDSLDGFEPDLSASVVEDYFADPFAHGHALLGHATTRLLYDPDSYLRSGGRQPARVSEVARETHVSDLPSGGRTKLRVRLTYSDGLGREIQRKGQAAPGPVSEGGPGLEHRWIASGWTVFDNKGKPVRTFESFFTATPAFEFAVMVGVSRVLFYDPIGRIAAVIAPDGGYGKTTFDPWYSDTWDAADTVLLDPGEDPDVAPLVGRYLASLRAQPGGWKTWYQRRVDGDLGRAAQRAAEQTARFAAGTPTRSWLDALGRAFLTVGHNRVPVAPGADEVTDQLCRTLNVLDIKGNVREVWDALGRAAMRSSFAMIGGEVAHEGMDSGGIRHLPDVLGKPVYGRDSRGFVERTEYDALHRPVRRFASGPCIDGSALTVVTEYGESVDDTSTPNLRGRVARLHDGAGVTISAGYDFKGNPLGSTRQIAQPYRGIALDWSGDVPLEPREYVSTTTYDALNRAITLTTPDGSVQVPAFDDASQLESLVARLRGVGASADGDGGPGDVTTFAEKIEYNARGQRVLIRYGNGTSTAYTYDPLTFRLTRLVTRRGHRRMQDLRYTYDPVGNPTQIGDRAQEDTFFRNQVVSARSRYVYDALYRLIEATGREHLGQTAMAGPVPPGATGMPRVEQPGDGAAMARYTERYTYDESGNPLIVSHRSSDRGRGGWTRVYVYDEPSLLEPGRFGNRLSGSGPAGSPMSPARFEYDEQGNTTSMPDLPLLRWDHTGRLHATSRHVGAAGQDTTYYGYDASGLRVRKVTERVPGDKKHERLYLGAFEVFREYGPDGSLILERETLNVFDDQHRLALVETRTAGTDPGPSELIRYQLANHQDSSVLELDEDGQVIGYEEYHPYGTTAYQAVRAGLEAPKRYRYTAKERDTETGLYYNAARYYVPWLGRWLSPDPAGLADGSNLYRYVRDNPVRWTDASGMEPGDDDLTCTCSSSPDTGGEALNYTPAGSVEGAETQSSSSANSSPAPDELNYTPAPASSSSSDTLNYTPAPTSSSSSSSSDELNYTPAYDYVPANTGPATDALNYTPANNASTMGAPFAAAGVFLPSGNYQFADSVANFLRREAGETFGEELVESMESGTLSPQVQEFVDRYGVDVAQELAEGYSETGKFVTLEEEAEGLESAWEVTHGESLASTPQAGMESGNLGLQSEVDHFAGDHANDFNKNPAEFRNPDYNVSSEAEAEVGESQLEVVSEAEDLGMTGEGVPSDAIDWFGEGAVETTETTEFVEGAGTAIEIVEVGEGFEAADLLILVFLL